MEPQEALIARLDALMDQFDGAKRAVGLEGFEARPYYRRAGESLSAKLDAGRQNLDEQRRRARSGKNNGGWAALREAEIEYSRLFGECLALLQAARSRGHAVEADLCEIADAFLQELASRLDEIKWDRFTVLASQDYFSDSAQIIRVRFPFCGVWDLPVCAHEFGHFVAGRLNISRPNGSHRLAFQEYREAFQKERGEEAIAHIDEYFADVFATYVLGPAYACTCLFLRFDPGSAHAEPGRTHPSYAKRAYAILAALRRMNMEGDSKGHFDGALQSLSGFWNAALSSAGQKDVVPEKDLVEGLVGEFYDMLKRGATLARFNRWKETGQLAIKLKGPVPPAGTAPDSAITDLLNGAWRSRLTKGTDVDMLNENLLKLCRQAAARIHA